MNFLEFQRHSYRLLVLWLIASSKLCLQELSECEYSVRQSQHRTVYTAFLSAYVCQSFNYTQNAQVFVYYPRHLSSCNKNFIDTFNCLRAANLLLMCPSGSVAINVKQISFEIYSFDETYSTNLFVFHYQTR